MAHKYFSQQLTPEMTQAVIAGEEAHHLAVVMRTKQGQALTLCDGAGRDYTAMVKAVQPDAVTLEITACFPSVSEPSLRVILYIGYPKQDKLEWIIQKATELGAVEIVPFFSRYCVVTPKKEEQKQVRHARIALEAAKQSGRGIVPQVGLPLSFQNMIKQAVQADCALFCYEAQQDASLLSRFEKGVHTLAIITGSEGGFSPEEAKQAVDAGCVSIGLGPRILRCETAPIAALSAVMALTGNLQ